MLVQWLPEISETWRRLLDWSYDFEYSNKHGIEQLWSVNRPISLN